MATKAYCLLASTCFIKDTLATSISLSDLRACMLSLHAYTRLLIEVGLQVL